MQYEVKSLKDTLFERSIRHETAVDHTTKTKLSTHALNFENQKQKAKHYEWLL